MKRTFKTHFFATVTSTLMLASLAGVVGATVFLGGCSDSAEMVSSNREPEFFHQFSNPAVNVLDAKDNLAALNVIETGEDYPMRFVLFDDGRFYYQVDKLGDGTGYWKYERGGIELTAVRPIFDMHIYLSAREAEGSETLVRFYDRHGFNSVNSHFVKQGKAPAMVKSEDLQGLTGDLKIESRATTLRPYLYSDKGI